MVAGAPVEVQSDSLPEAFEQRRQLAFGAVALDPQLPTSAGVSLCMYQLLVFTTRRFSLS